MRSESASHAPSTYDEPSSESTQADGPVDIDQLAQVATLTKELDDPNIMSNAWS